MRRRKPGGELGPSAALPPGDSAPAADAELVPASAAEDDSVLRRPRAPAAVRVMFVRRHRHRGIWYDPGQELHVSPDELELLRTFAEIELP